MDFLESRFGDDRETAQRLSRTMNRLFDEAISLSQTGVSPDSAQGQAFAQEFWAFITEFTKGDMSQLPQLTEMGKMVKDEVFQKRQALAKQFIAPALDAYFKKLNHNPFEEVSL